MMNCKNYARNKTLTISQMMRLVGASDNGMDILAGNFVDNINSTIFKRIFNSGSLN